ncbi:hypothetical protein Pelo_6062 [Pelomyxa schiedti]|nr:hypothetical protein Pelo_6062 [Pelomyxa schiedti]
MECTSYINISKNTDEVDHRVPVILPLSSGQRSGCRWHLELWQSPEDGTDELTIMGSSLRATWLWKVNVKLTYAARGSLIFTQDMVKWYNSAPSEHLFVTRDGNPAVYTKSIGSYRPGLGCLMYPASGEQVTLKHQFCNVEKVDSNHFAIETSVLPRWRGSTPHRA